MDNYTTVLYQDQGVARLSAINNSYKLYTTVYVVEVCLLVTVVHNNTTGLVGFW